MTKLHGALRALVGKQREDVLDFLAVHGNKVISQVTVQQACNGLRGVVGLVCDTSHVDPERGLVVRGVPIGKLTSRLPEELFFLLVTGRLPSADELADLQAHLTEHQSVPDEVWSALEALPKGTDAVTMLNVGVLTLEKDSLFRRRYRAGMRKADHWEAALEDSIRLLAKLPALAAGIYRMKYRKGKRLAPRPRLDWAANFARMLGVPDKDGTFRALVSLTMTLNCDHEGGNPSALAAHVVSSTLADPYHAVSAGLNALAGPLHGLATQECLGFLQHMLTQFGGKVPSVAELRKYTERHLDSGRVVPGYGHSVLRATDPRFAALLAFGRKHCRSDLLLKLVERLYAVAPGVLRERGRAKDPWPNVDAITGCLLHHYGVTEVDFYTVFSAVSRSLGLTAQLILHRGLGTAITRPRSVTWARLRELAESSPGGARRSDD